MDFRAEAVELLEVAAWRDAYRAEMDCQIIHDSIHGRPGWSREYLLSAGGRPVGYGSVAIGGPWRDRPTAYEVYVEPEARADLIDLFGAFLRDSGAVAIEVQSNDRLGAMLIHAFARDVAAEKILFEDGGATQLDPCGAAFRRPTPQESPELTEDQLRWHGILEYEGEVVASGGILLHYNPPYGDVFMDVAEPFRRRGFGSYLIQELKRVCYEGGRVPGARCSPDNLASRRTLQKAGFVPCGHLLTGRVAG